MQALMQRGPVSVRCCLGAEQALNRCLTADYQTFIRYLRGAELVAQLVQCDAQILKLFRLQTAGAEDL